MKTALIILSLAIAGSAQTRLRQCNDSSAITANSESAKPAPGSSQTRPTLAAKPENSRSALPPVLPQIRYRRPPAQPGASCWCGSVGARSLITAQPIQEVPMISLAGNFRFDHLLLQESARFSSNVVSGLTVSAGLSNDGADLVHGFELMSPGAPQNFALEMPEPPVLQGTYNLVLKFAGTSPLAVAGSSNFASGTLNWEVCGYQVH